LENTENKKMKGGELSLKQNDLEQQIMGVQTFADLVSTPFAGNVNAMFWERELRGDFKEIADKLTLLEPITSIDPEELLDLTLSQNGELARQTILTDWELLKAQGAMPTLNLLKHYDRDESNPVFATDVYSFHVDRSPVATDTFLCTYFGQTSEILPNAFAEQKVQIPAIRKELKKLYDGSDEDFEAFLIENFFDLHYQAKPHSNAISLGIGQIYRLAVDYPGSEVLPCIHRAPLEKEGEYRLMLIC